MKTCYIAVGGIGSKILRKHICEKKLNNSKYFYFDAAHDTSEYDMDEFDGGYRFEFPDDYTFKDEKMDGTGVAREIGKDLLKFSLYTNAIPDLIDDFFDDDIKMVFITTTFGGFGSAIVYDLVEYLNIQLKKKYATHSIKNYIIAFAPDSYSHIFFNARLMMNSFEINTMNFINDYSYYGYRKSMFFPEIELYVPDVKGMDSSDYYMLLDYSQKQLAEIDKKRFFLSDKRKDEYDVFVSYSSQDQRIADMLIKSLNAHGMKTWIATENINAGSYAKQIVNGIRNSSIFVVIISKNSIESQHVLNEIDQAFKRLGDGMKIMPLMIDDAEMSDECSYYLARQESFYGNKPPIEVKIEEFIRIVGQELGK